MEFKVGDIVESIYAGPNKYVIERIINKKYVDLIHIKNDMKYAAINIGILKLIKRTIITNWKKELQNEV